MISIHTSISAMIVSKHLSFCKIRPLRKILLKNYPEERDLADLETKSAPPLLVLLALVTGPAAYSRFHPILQPTEVDIILFFTLPLLSPHTHSFFWLVAKGLGECLFLLVTWQHCRYFYFYLFDGWKMVSYLKVVLVRNSFLSKIEYLFSILRVTVFPF